MIDGPDDDGNPAEGQDPAGDAGDADADDGSAPLVDVSGALGMAGHEIEDLGLEGVEDSAPVLHGDDDDEVDFDHRAGADIATRGQGHP